MQMQHEETFKTANVKMDAYPGNILEQLHNYCSHYFCVKGHPAQVTAHTEVFAKVDSSAALLTYYTCSCCEVSLLAVRRSPLCSCVSLWSTSSCLLLWTKHQCQLCTCACYVSCRWGPDVVNLCWWKVDFVQVWLRERGGERGRYHCYCPHWTLTSVLLLRGCILIWVHFQVPSFWVISCNA